VERAAGRRCGHRRREKGGKVANSDAANVDPAALRGQYQPATRRSSCNRSATLCAIEQATS
jgi:hypothetical protein